MPRPGASNHPPRALNLQPDKSSPDFLVPILEGLLYQRHKLISNGAVDQAVIVTESEMDNGTDGDRIVAVLIGDDQWLLGNAANPHDGGVWLIDDRQTEDGAELAGIRDGECRALNVLGLQFLAAGALAKIRDAPLQAEEVEVSGVFQGGHNESPIKSHGNSDIDLAMVADVIAFQKRVDNRPLLQTDDGRTHEEWHEGEPHAVPLLESIFVLRAQVNDAGEIHFIHTVNVRTGSARLDHALRDDFAHVAHWNQITRIGSRGSSWRWGRPCGRGAPDLRGSC